MFSDLEGSLGIDETTNVTGRIEMLIWQNYASSDVRLFNSRAT